jgi:hypothetical protein
MPELKALDYNDRALLRSMCQGTPFFLAKPKAQPAIHQSCGSQFSLKIPIKSA